MRKRGLYWQARPKAGEKLGKWRSTRCTDLRAAQAVLADWERELADPAYRAAQGATLAQAVDRVNREFQQLVRVGKRSQATADYYLEKTGVLLSVLGNGCGLSAVDAGTVDRFIEVRREEQVSEHTIAKELGCLRVVLKAAKRSGWWVGEIDAVLPHAFGTQAKPRERFVSSMLELGKILRAVHSPDIAAQIAFSVATGAEAQAIVRAQWADLSERYVALHGKKRPTRERVVPIVAGWQENLILFVRNHAGGDRTTPQLFVHVQGIRKALRLACQKLGIAHVSPNDLRRTFQVWMREAGVSIEERAQAMGHASTRMLSRFVYGKLSPEMLRDRMREAFDAKGNGRSVARAGPGDGGVPSRDDRSRNMVGAVQYVGDRQPGVMETFDGRGIGGVVGGDGARRVRPERGSGEGADRGQEVQSGAGAGGMAEPGRDAEIVGERRGGDKAPTPSGVDLAVTWRSVLCQPAVTDAGGGDRTEPHISSPENCDPPLKEAPRARFERATHGLTVRRSPE